MANSLILRSPAIATYTARPKFARDPMIRPGTKFLYDWSRGHCHPSGSIVAGTIGVGSEMLDLGHDGITAAVSGGVTFEVAAGGGLVNASSVLDYIAIGAAGQFDMAPAEYEYVLTAWIKLPASGYTTNNYFQLLGLSSDNTAANAQVWIDMGAGGLRPRCAVGNYIYGAQSDITPGAVYQLAVHYQPGAGRLDFYINGARVHGATAPASVVSASAAQFRISGLVKKTIYRVSLTDITASLVAEEAQGFAANARLTGPQHILREYQFCTGQIAAAPKAEFA